MQNLTSRIAGVDSEQMTNRAIGMGAMLGFGLGAIKEQFKVPNSNNGDGNKSGFKGLMDRAKEIVSPSLNLSDEKDYDGNINPIRDVIPKEKQVKNTINSISNGITKNDNRYEDIKPKSMARKVASAGFNATKAYLGMGAKLAEGDFMQNQYNPYKNSKKKDKFQRVEYINKIAEKSGDINGFKGQEKK